MTGLETMTIELPDAVSMAAWIATALSAVIVFLLGGLLWLVKREIRHNDKAHENLSAAQREQGNDIRKLLVDVGFIRGWIEGRQKGTD